mmetsp:Transcript_17167/g.28076  ORF Transcript_17167/g.28076 Transcript_17167/m.28076 type:complete len:200 (+) Transcript_17167:824-1423(+)
MVPTQSRMMMSLKNNLVSRICRRSSRRSCRKWSRVINNGQLWSQMQNKVIHSMALQNKMQVKQPNFLHMKPLGPYLQSVLRNQKTKYMKPQSQMQQVRRHLRKKPWMLCSQNVRPRSRSLLNHLRANLTNHPRKKPWRLCSQNVLPKSRSLLNRLRTNLTSHLLTKPWRHYSRNALLSQMTTQRRYFGKILNMPNTSKC